jgi:hypothetical protein
MDTEEKLAWSALEYEERERSKDWFWALGIIVVTSALAALIFGNYFFATLLMLGGFLLGYFATKKPAIVHFELNAKGLKIDNRIYPYENIKSFWIQINPADMENVKPLLFIHSERVFMPVLSIPIDETIAQDIYSIFSAQNIAEVEMKEHPTEKIMEVLGF